MIAQNLKAENCPVAKPVLPYTATSKYINSHMDLYTK